MMQIRSDKTAVRAKRPQARRASRAPARQLPWGTWLNRGLILCAVGVVGFVSSLAWSHLAELPVERVIIEGDVQHTSSAELEALVQPALAGGFLRTDLNELRTQLELLPWIFSAQVRRQWPASLQIEVVEQLPIARWGDSGFLNHEGEVFQSNRVEGAVRLPLLSGPEGREAQVVASYQQLMKLLSPLELTVASLEMDARGGMRAGLGNGIELNIGDRDLDQRVARFAAVYRASLAAQVEQVARVDLRYRNGLAVAYKTPVEVAGI